MRSALVSPGLYFQVGAGSFGLEWGNTDESFFMHLCGAYAGRGASRNVVDDEAKRNLGPIPRGQWRVGRSEPTHGKLGPNVFALSPLPETETFGRSGFFIHGDRSGGQEASHGCVVVGPAVRAFIRDVLQPNHADLILSVF